MTGGDAAGHRVIGGSAGALDPLKEMTSVSSIKLPAAVPVRKVLLERSEA